MMLDKVQIRTIPSGIDTARIKLGPLTNIDVCDAMGTQPSGEGKCFLTDSLVVDMTKITSVSLPIGISIEAYNEVRWDCVRLTRGPRTADLNGKNVPADFKTWTFSTSEKVVIDVIKYTQTFPYAGSTMIWPDMSTKNAEIDCDQSPNRMSFANRGCMTSHGWSDYCGGCRHSCTVTPRPIPPSTRMPVKTIKFCSNT
jgi:hypothetical protein